MVELLLAVAQHAGQPSFRQEAPLLVAIFHEVYKNIDPKQLLAVKRPKNSNNNQESSKRAVLAVTVSRCQVPPKQDSAPKQHAAQQWWQYTMLSDQELRSRVESTLCLGICQTEKCCWVDGAVSLGRCLATA